MPNQNAKLVTDWLTNFINCGHSWSISSTKGELLAEKAAIDNQRCRICFAFVTDNAGVRGLYRLVIA